MSRCCGSRHNFRESGEVNTASNLGEGEGIFERKLGIDLQFKSLVAGSNITLSSTSDEITIESTGGGAIGIENQIASPQTADFWISGVMKSDSNALINSVPVGVGGYTTNKFLAVAIGESVFSSGNTLFPNNVGIGFECAASCVGAADIVALGFQAMAYNAEGNGVVAVGPLAGTNFNGGGNLTKVDQGVFIGAYSRSLANNSVNEIVIGDHAIGAGNNTTTIGNSSTVSTVLKGTVTGNQFNVASLNAAPPTASSTGTTGEIRVTSGFIYVCIATDTWVRTALTTF